MKTGSVWLPLLTPITPPMPASSMASLSSTLTVSLPLVVLPADLSNSRTTLSAASARNCGSQILGGRSWSSLAHIMAPAEMHPTSRLDATSVSDTHRIFSTTCGPFPLVLRPRDLWEAKRSSRTALRAAHASSRSGSVHSAEVKATEPHLTKRATLRCTLMKVFSLKASFMPRPTAITRLKSKPGTA